MNIPEILYYKKQTANVEYTHVKTNELDVGRFIQGKPFWRKSVSSHKRLCKKIIITDWTASDWLPTKIETVCETINTLKTQGFDVYVWQGKHKEIIPINDPELFFFNSSIRRKIQPFNPSELLRIGSDKLNTPTDQIHLLDDYWMNELLGSNLESPKRQISLHSFNQLNKSAQEEILSYLKMQMPPVTILVDDDISPERDFGLETLRELPGITMVKSTPYAMTIDPSQACTDEFAQILKNTRTLQFTKPITQEQMHWVLLVSANLSSFSACLNNEDLQFSFEPNSLPSLTEFNVEHFGQNRKAQNLIALLNAAPNLIRIETLDIYWEADSLVQILKDQKYPKVKQLILGDLSSLSDLSALLNAFPNIVHLKVNSELEEFVDLEEDTLELSPGSLPNLKSLELELSDFDLLKSILDAAPNLVRLEKKGVYDSHTWGNDGFIEENSLPTIRELIFKELECPNSQMIAMISACSNLETLHLHQLNFSCVGMDEGDILSPPLQNLIIGQLNLVKDETYFQKFFNNILKQGQLKKLYFYDSKISNLVLENIKEVEEIHFINCRFSLIAFKSMVECSPKLKRLVLFNSVNALSDVFHQQQELPVSLPGVIVEVSQHEYKSIEKIESIIRDAEITSIPAPYINSEATTLVPADPVHNTHEFIDYQPPGNKPFNFTNANQTKNQEMIQDKLCQYLILCHQIELQQNPHIISTIQNGICNALAYFFKEQDNLDDWGQFLEDALRWSGELHDLTDDLTVRFNRLYQIINQIYVSPSPHENNESEYVDSELFFSLLRDKFSEKLQFINILETILGLSKVEAIRSVGDFQKDKYIVCNPWHAIAIVGRDAYSWVIYDPYFIDGAKVFDVTTAIGQKNFFQTITDSLGTVLLIQAEPPKDAIDISMLHHPAPLFIEVSDTQQFIKKGGLLALRFAKNRDTVIESIMRAVDFANALDNSSLKGILLRDASRGRPAWYHGINLLSSKIHVLTWELLAQFIIKNPNDFIPQLKDSLSLIEPEEVDAIMAFVEKWLCSTRPELEKLFNRLAISNELEKKLLISQKNEDHLTHNIDENPTTEPSKLARFCIERINSDVKRRLIKLNSSKSILSLQLAFQRFCLDSNRPLFIISSPDDLVCSASFIEPHGRTGVLRKGPGGPLHAFLKKNRNNNPVIIINFRESVIACNSIIDDKNPHADGTPLPENITIIAFINTSKPDCYLGADFLSRFDIIEDGGPIPTKELERALPELPVHFTDKLIGPDAINLFYASGWENRLLGQWVLDQQQLIFQEGELIRALACGSALEIGRGLWDDLNFQRFWQEALLYKSIHYAGKSIAIPDDLQLIGHDKYDWERLVKQLTVASIFPGPTDIVINPHQLNTCFSRYDCDNARKELIHHDGLIKANAQAELAVNITRSISEDQWAMLLTECERHGVNLTAYCAPGVIIPEELAKQIESSMAIDYAIQPWDPSTLAKTQIIVSTDVDTTVEMLDNQGHWQIIDISECKPSDLLTRINGALNQDTLHFEFNTDECALLHALKNNCRVILKGQFSEELIDNLAPLLLARLTDENPSGQLILVSDDPSAELFTFYPVSEHEVSLEEKAQFLNLFFNELEPFLAEESLSELRARQRYLKAFPDGDSDNTWLGFHNLPPIQVPYEEDTVETFIQKRKQQVNGVLANSPYVFISGLSGVGKSTFITNDFLSPDDTLYVGVKNSEAWAKDNTSKRKILFLDEANLENELSKFNDLFNKQPSILLNGQFYLLTPNHKVIFAGNPATYGSERHVAPLFEQHGNCIIFDPIPPAIIAEKILKPVFSTLGWSDIEITTCCAQLLDIYRYLCEQSTTDCLISPRELQTIALLIVSSVDKSQVDLLQATRQIAWSIARNLLPKHKQNPFDNLFKPDFCTPLAPIPSPAGFHLTPSREPIWSELHGLLLLREQRRAGILANNDAQLYGGLGGIVIEGEPGVGKSELVKAALESRGYHKIEDIDAPVIAGNQYYLMPASMPVSDKRALLLKAFDEGAVVVIDEINSSSLIIMEDLLNHLLMGMTPDGKPPKHPGFMLIGTQNPVKMGGGRLAASTALLRRLMNLDLPVYSSTEMITILTHHMGHQHHELIEALVLAFENQLIQAKKDPSVTMPTFRSLLKLAEREKTPAGINVAEDALSDTELQPKRQKRGYPDACDGPRKKSTVERDRFFNPSPSKDKLASLKRPHEDDSDINDRAGKKTARKAPAF